MDLLSPAFLPFLQLCPALLLLHGFRHDTPLDLSRRRLGHDIREVDLWDETRQ
jgi:hypothetical protein